MMWCDMTWIIFLKRYDGFDSQVIGSLYVREASTMMWLKLDISCRATIATSMSPTRERHCGPPSWLALVRLQLSTRSAWTPALTRKSPKIRSQSSRLMFLVFFTIPSPEICCQHKTQKSSKITRYDQPIYVILYHDSCTCVQTCLNCCYDRHVFKNMFNL